MSTTINYTNNDGSTFAEDVSKTKKQKSPYSKNVTSRDTTGIIRAASQKQRGGNSGKKAFEILDQTSSPMNQINKSF
jgi:hypothetical protein